MTISRRTRPSPCLVPQIDVNELEAKLRARRIKVEGDYKGPATFALDDPNCDAKEERAGSFNTPVQSPRTNQPRLEDTYGGAIEESECIYDLINHLPHGCVMEVTQMNQQLQSKHNDALKEIATLRAQLDASNSDRESLRAQMCQQQLTNQAVAKNANTAVAEVAEFEQASITAEQPPKHTSHSKAVAAFWEGFRQLEEEVDRFEQSYMEPVL